MGPLKKGTVYEAIYKLDGDEFSLAMYFGEGSSGRRSSSRERLQRCCRHIQA